LAFLLPTALKRYCIQIFAARYFGELARLAKFAKSRAREKNGFYSINHKSWHMMSTVSIFFILLLFKELTQKPHTVV